MKNSNRIIVCVAMLMSLQSAAYAQSTETAARTIGMVTGGKVGTYMAFGKDIARVAEGAGVTVNVLDSKGSLDNIRRITSKEKAGLAIVQSDVMGLLSRSKNGESVDLANKLRMVAPLFNEEVHILARSSINSMNDLNGKNVIVGGEGSGSTITATNLFQLLNITPKSTVAVDPILGVRAVLSGESDAVVFVGGKPVKMFKNIEELGKIKVGPNAGKLDQVHFLAIKDDRLSKEYKPAVLTHADYDFVTTDVPTVSVAAVLISYDYTRKKNAYYQDQCQTMGLLLRSMYDNLIELKANGHPKWKEVDLNAEMPIWKRDECTASVAAAAKSGVASQLQAVAPAAAPATKGLESDLLGIIKGEKPQPGKK